MKALLGFFVAWAGFLLLWLLFVYQISRSELLAGSIGAALTVVAGQVSLQFEPLRFQPRLTWLAQVWRLPSMILEDFRILFRVLARRLGSKPVPGVFQLARFHSSRPDPREGARCSLAVLFLSLSPNSVVVGIDQDQGILLLHQLLPAPVPELKHKLEED
jgi:multisubunit Na+/H+ antiporter MnhE subunit